MLRSIRAEWYKAVRRPYFPILFLTCTLLTVGAVYCLYLIKTQSPGITPIGLPFALSLSPWAWSWASGWWRSAATWSFPSSTSTTP